MQSGVASRSETAWRGVSGAVCNAARNIRCSCCPSLLQFVCPGSPQENNTLNNSLFVLRSVTIDRGAKQIVGAGTATAEVGCGSLCCYSNRAYSRTQTVRNTGTHNLPLHLTRATIRTNDLDTLVYIGDLSPRQHRTARSSCQEAVSYTHLRAPRD